MFTIVPRRVTETSADIFVGAFGRTEQPPRLRLQVSGLKSRTVQPWQVIDGGRAEPIYWWSSLLEGLTPNTFYSLQLLDGPNELATAHVETLPLQLPSTDSGTGHDRPFTLWLSSCFCARQSPEGLGAMLEQVLDDPRQRPHLKLMVGDQVYLDELSLFIYTALSEGRLRSRFNQQYARTWTHPDFARLLSAGANYFLADDHELWNNYPNSPVGIAIRSRAFWRSWFRLAYLERCQPIQAVRPIEQLDIGQDLSLFFADTRIDRGEALDMFMAEGNFAGPASGERGSWERLAAWLSQLRTPGVLVLQQPVIAAAGSGRDRKLADYAQYWHRLLPALHACRQDLVILAGDAHAGSIARTILGRGSRQHQLLQVVSSPLALVSPIAAATPEHVPCFPAVDVGTDPSPVEYPMRVPTYRAGPVVRAEEHAMTIAFWRRDEYSLGMRVRCWLARSASRHAGPVWETTIRSGAPRAAARVR
jgi:hypothetical protein